MDFLPRRNALILVWGNSPLFAAILTMLHSSNNDKGDR